MLETSANNMLSQPVGSTANSLTDDFSLTPMDDSIPMRPENEIESNWSNVSSINHDHWVDPSKFDHSKDLSEVSVADFMRNHPDASPEEIMKYMSQFSDEWAEKYLDYLTETGAIDKANEYTAGREDTAYQRLVEDLRKAGLNPALLYSGSASPSASGSSGYVNMSEGANSRSVSNYKKLKDLLLSAMMANFNQKIKTTNTVISGVGVLGKLISSIFKLFM